MRSLMNGIKHCIGGYSTAEMAPKVAKNPVFPQWKSIKARRISNLDQEIFRLCQNQRIAESLDQICAKSPMTLAERVAVGHTLEIQQMAAKTHYVFNHGANQTIMVVATFAKAMRQLANPREDLSQFHILRDEVFLKNALDWSVSEAKQALRHTTDWDYRKELLCADPLLESTEVAESAYSYFTGFKNIALREVHGFAAKLIESIAGQYVADDKAKDIAVREIVKLTGASTGHSLYTVCIPREKIEDLGYRAHPMGAPCEHFAGATDRDVLESLQRGETVHMCSYYGESNRPPQYRLLLGKLTKENGVAVFRNTSMLDSELASMKRRVKQVAKGLMKSR